MSSTTKQRFNVDGLEPGKFYYFAVSAIGSAGESSKSEPAEVMAAA
ncbi:MAG: fibronectin type III domain-containing protein [Flavobacteriales bacterium]|nr:fibronectin type III domain-containing protein [Flavobacteriales bacterium]